MGKKMLRGECVCVYSNDSPSRTYTTSHDSLDDDEPANDVRSRRHAVGAPRHGFLDATVDPSRG